MDKPADRLCSERIGLLCLFSKFFRKLIGDSIKCDTKKDRIVKFDRISIPPETGGGLLYDFYLEDFKWKSWKELNEKTE